MSFSTLLILIVVFTACSFFFSVNTIALRIFSRGRLQEAFKQIDREEKAAILIDRAEWLVLACSFYRFVFNMLILLMVLSLFIKLNNNAITVSLYVFSVILSLLIFSIFSLAIPHAWAKYAGETILCRTYPILIGFAFLIAPIVWMFGWYDTIVKRLAGIAETTPEEDREEKQEEFLTDLEHQRMKGVVDEEEQEMIENVLELSETSADEIMTPRTDIVAVEVNSDLNTVLDIIKTGGHTRVPVYEETIDNIVGLVYAKDLLKEVGNDVSKFKLRDKLRQAYFVPETKHLRDLLHEFQNQKLHIAIVLDEYGGTAGIVTLEDILEELVGEISDEYEKTPPKPIRVIDETTIETDARTYVDDVNDEFDLDLPEDEDYDTIGGFVFSHLGYIPKTGETFHYGNLWFTIISAEARRIKRIRIKKEDTGINKGQ